MTEITINQFKFDTANVDAVAFYKDKDNNNYNCHFMKMENWNDGDVFELTEFGYKFVIFIREKDSVDYIRYEAILGNPSFIIGNQLKAGSQGIILKKCKRSIDLVDSFQKKISLQKGIQLLKEYIMNKSKEGE